MQIVSSTEDSSVVRHGLRILNRLANEALRHVKVLVSDMAPCFINAWRDEFPELPIKHVKCAWHVENAWKRRLLPHDPELRDYLSQLRLMPTEAEFWAFYKKLEQE